MPQLHDAKYESFEILIIVKATQNSNLFFNNLCSTQEVFFCSIVTNAI